MFWLAGQKYLSSRLEFSSSQPSSERVSRSENLYPYPLSLFFGPVAPPNMFSRDTDVYTGVWINHSLGKIHGATLTLTSDNGGLLIAFLAIFVGAAAGSFWKIARYVLHMSFSSEKKLDAVHHQRQAILRNTQLPSDAALDLLMARFAWRGRAKKLDRKLTFVAFFAFIVYAAFTVAGMWQYLLFDPGSQSRE